MSNQIPLSNLSNQNTSSSSPTIHALAKNTVNMSMSSTGSPVSMPMPQNGDISAGMAAQDQSTIHNTYGYGGVPPSPMHGAGGVGGFVVPPQHQQQQYRYDDPASQDGGALGVGVESDRGTVLASTKPPEGFIVQERMGGLRAVTSNLFFTITLVLSLLAWLVALISQAISTSQIGNTPIATLWPALFLQLATILLLLIGLYTSSLTSYLQLLSHFTTILVVLGALGIDRTIFSKQTRLSAVAAAWVILTIINMLWLIVSASDLKGSVWRYISALGHVDIVLIRGHNYYAPVPVAGGASGDRGAFYPVSRPVSSFIPAIAVHSPSPPNAARSDYRSSKSAATSELKSQPRPESNFTESKTRDSVATAGALSQANTLQTQTAPSQDIRSSVTSVSALETVQSVDGRVAALFSYSASPQDPNEISFQKGDVMDVIDRTGKWWEVRKQDGSSGIAPSNYLLTLPQ